MERAVSRGQMVPAEFHRKKAEMRESLASGMDDGRSKTSGLLGGILLHYTTSQVIFVMLHLN